MSRQKIGIEDVARAANVSRATVDRVINGRGGVRAVTLARVEAALQELNYAPTALAALKKTEPTKLRVILPTTGYGTGVNELWNAFERVLQQAPYARWQYDRQMVELDKIGDLARALSDVPAQTDAVLTVGDDTPEVVAAIDALTERGVRVVTLLWDSPHSKRVAHIGPDDFAAGQAVARMTSLCAGREARSAGVVIAAPLSPHRLQQVAGLRSRLKQIRPDLRLIYPARRDTRAPLTQLKSLASHHQVPDVLCWFGPANRLDDIKKTELTDVPVVMMDNGQAAHAALAVGQIESLLSWDLLQMAQRALWVASDTGSKPEQPSPVRIFVQENAEAQAA